MDPIENPFAPGAGTPPPELAGRDELRETIRIALERVRRGLPGKSVLMVGSSGVGKTVLLDRMRDDAEASGIQTLRIEAAEDRSLPALLAPQLRMALLRLSHIERAQALAQRALRAVAGFAGALKMKYEGIEVGLDFEPEPGLADNGDLEHDLQACWRRQVWPRRQQRRHWSSSLMNSNTSRRKSLPRSSPHSTARASANFQWSSWELGFPS